MIDCTVKLQNKRESYRLFTVDTEIDITCAKLVDDRPQSAWIELKDKFNVRLSKRRVGNI
jgi:hypothetical protein